MTCPRWPSWYALGLGFTPRQPGSGRSSQPAACILPQTSKDTSSRARMPWQASRLKRGCELPRPGEEQAEHMGAGQDGMTWPFSNGTRQCCLGQPQVPVTIIYVGREETKSHGERGRLVVILAPKLHVNPCGELIVAWHCLHSAAEELTPCTQQGPGSESYEERSERSTCSSSHLN